MHARCDGYHASQATQLHHMFASYDGYKVMGRLMAPMSQNDVDLQISPSDDGLCHYHPVAFTCRQFMDYAKHRRWWTPFMLIIEPIICCTLYKSTDACSW